MQHTVTRKISECTSVQTRTVASDAQFLKQDTYLPRFPTGIGMNLLSAGTGIQPLGTTAGTAKPWVAQTFTAPVTDTTITAVKLYLGADSTTANDSLAVNLATCSTNGTRVVPSALMTDGTPLISGSLFDGSATKIFPYILELGTPVDIKAKGNYALLFSRSGATDNTSILLYGRGSAQSDLYAGGECVVKVGSAGSAVVGTGGWTIGTGCKDIGFELYENKGAYLQAVTVDWANTTTSDTITVGVVDPTKSMIKTMPLDHVGHAGGTIIAPKKYEVDEYISKGDYILTDFFDADATNENVILDFEFRFAKARVG